MRREKLLLLAGISGLIGLAVLPSAARAETGGWAPFSALPEPSSGTVGTQEINGHLYRERLQGVWGSAPNDVWAVGTGGWIIHWNGKAWSNVRSGTNNSFSGIWGSGPKDVWAVTGRSSQGSILHWNGTAWSTTVSSDDMPSTLTAIWGSGPKDVWAIGDNVIMHWNGSAWSTNYKSENQLSGIWGSGPKDVWAVGVNVILHLDGKGEWTDTGHQGGGYAVGGSGPQDVWVVGSSGGIIHWNGTEWSRNINSGAGAALESVWCKGPKDVWVGGQGVMLHWNGKAWLASWGDPSGYNAKHAVSMWWTGGEAWAVGTQEVKGSGGIPEAFALHYQ